MGPELDLQREAEVKKGGVKKGGLAPSAARCLSPLFHLGQAGHPLGGCDGSLPPFFDPHQDAAIRREPFDGSHQARRADRTEVDHVAPRPTQGFADGGEARDHRGPPIAANHDNWRCANLAERGRGSLKARAEGGGHVAYDARSEGVERAAGPLLVKQRRKAGPGPNLDELPNLPGGQPSGIVPMTALPAALIEPGHPAQMDGPRDRKALAWAAVFGNGRIFARHGGLL